GALTSAPSCSSARTRATSLARAASATGVSTGAAAGPSTGVARGPSSAASTGATPTSSTLTPRIEAARRPTRPLPMEPPREVERAVAVAERLEIVDAELVEQGQHDVRHRRARGGPDVVLALEQTVRSADQEERAADVVVQV